MSSLKRTRSWAWAGECVDYPRPAKQTAASRQERPSPSDHQFAGDANTHKYTWGALEASDVPLFFSDEADAICQFWEENINDNKNNPPQWTTAQTNPLIRDCLWDERRNLDGFDGYTEEEHGAVVPTIEEQSWIGLEDPQHSTLSATHPLSTPEALDSAASSDYVTPKKKNMACLESARTERTPLLVRHRADATTVLLSTTEEAAVLDSRHALILNELRTAAKSLRLEFFVSGDMAICPHKSSTRNDLKAEINVYGNRSDIVSVSLILSGAGIYLQEPDQLDPSVHYHNPHVLSWEDQDVTPRFRGVLPSVEAKFETVVEQILDKPEEHRLTPSSHKTLG